MFLWFLFRHHGAFHFFSPPDISAKDVGIAGFAASANLVVFQIGKFAECAGDLSCVQIACAAVFVSLNNSSIDSNLGGVDESEKEHRVG